MTANHLHLADSAQAPPKASLKGMLLDVGVILRQDRPLAAPVIDGALRKGEVGLLVGGTKSAKTWAIIHLHTAMATGGSWLGYPCRGGRTLIIDAELTASTLGHRIRAVAALYENVTFNADILPLRQTPTDIDALLRLLDEIEPGTYSLITIDPLYKLIPAEADENNQPYIASLFTRLIAAATRLNAAVLCVHHTTKGNQAAKGIADIGSGAGAQSRAVDWHAALREHAAPGHVSLHSIARSFPPTPPSVWEVNIPEIIHRPNMDADELSTGRRKKATPAIAPDKAKPEKPEKPVKPPKPTWRDIAAKADSEPRGIGWYAAQVCNGREHTAKSLLRQAVEMGALFRWESSIAGGAPRWAKTAPPG